jgi:Flp pilus assembly protein TadG
MTSFHRTRFNQTNVNRTSFRMGSGRTNLIRASLVQSGLAQTDLVQTGLRRLAGDTSGAEIAEAAAVLPIMFMMLLGIFWFGQAFSIYGTITRAAQEGARAGAAQVCTTCATGNPVPTNAYNAVQSTLIAAKLNPAKLQLPSTRPSLNSCVNGAAVSCDASPANVCVQENVQLSSTTNNVCGVSVSLQYPYQFWLPFTSLNQQLIHIYAAASVRQETM